MEDEYGAMDSDGETFVVPRFTLESGEVLREATVRYKTWGALNEARDNVMVVCHAMTGNAALDQWWGGLLGPGCVFDTDKYHVVCANILGSCYGSSGPADANPATGRKYGGDFPAVTVRDTVALHRRMVEEGVGARGVSVVVGGSLGGMQALEWAFHEDLVDRAVVMACGGRHHAWQIAISEAQRQAIYSDPAWRGGHYAPSRPPHAGLSIARQFAMVSYRTHTAYEDKFGRSRQGEGEGDDGAHAAAVAAGEAEDTFEVESYLRYQGERFLSRFDAGSYVAITKQMDTHDVGRGRNPRGCHQEALRALNTPVLVVGITSDVLYPVAEQEELAALIPNAKLAVIDSPEGHDGFLLEQEAISSHLNEFLNPTAKVNRAGLKRTVQFNEGAHSITHGQMTEGRHPNEGYKPAMAAF